MRLRRRPHTRNRGGGFGVEERFVDLGSRYIYQLLENASRLLRSNKFPAHSFGKDEPSPVVLVALSPRKEGQGKMGSSFFWVLPLLEGVTSRAKTLENSRRYTLLRLDGGRTGSGGLNSVQHSAGEDFSRIPLLFSGSVTATSIPHHAREKWDKAEMWSWGRNIWHMSVTP